MDMNIWNVKLQYKIYGFYRCIVALFFEPNLFLNPVNISDPLGGRLSCMPLSLFFTEIFNESCMPDNWYYQERRAHSLPS